MTWMNTINGNEYHYGPDTNNKCRFSIDEIAHSLAQINRFTGHAKRPYSVAEHSLLCLDIARGMGLEPRVLFAVLMHDAHEAYTSDLNSPAKWHIGAAWRDFEHTEAHKLRKHYNLLDVFREHKAVIQHIDLCALATERRDIMNFSAEKNSMWAVLDTPGSKIEPMAARLDDPGRASMKWTGWRDGFLWAAADIAPAQGKKL